MSRFGHTHHGNRKREPVSSSPKTRGQRAPQLGLTPERRATFLAQLERTGLFVDAARACGVDAATAYQWRKKHPDFEEECQSVSRKVDARIGETARLVLEMRLQDMASRYRPPKQVVTGHGEVVETLQEPVFDTQAMRMGLTKHNPDYTHPKQQVEISEAEKVESAADAAEERLKEYDKSRAEEYMDNRTTVHFNEEGIKVTTTGLPKKKSRKRRRRKR